MLSAPRRLTRFVHRPVAIAVVVVAVAGTGVATALTVASAGGTSGQAALAPAHVRLAGNGPAPSVVSPSSAPTPPASAIPSPAVATEPSPARPAPIPSPSSIPVAAATWPAPPANSIDNGEFIDVGPLATPVPNEALPTDPARVSCMPRYPEVLAADLGQTVRPSCTITAQNGLAGLVNLACQTGLGQPLSATWCSTPGSIVLAAGGSATVPVTVTVPAGDIASTQLMYLALSYHGTPLVAPNLLQLNIANPLPPPPPPPPPDVSLACRYVTEAASSAGGSSLAGGTPPPIGGTRLYGWVVGTCTVTPGDARAASATPTIVVADSGSAGTKSPCVAGSQDELAPCIDQAIGNDYMYDLPTASGTFWFGVPVPSLSSTYSLNIEVWEFSTDYQTTPFSYAVGSDGTITLSSS